MAVSYTHLDVYKRQLLDRIDIQVEMDAVTLEEIETAREQEGSQTVRRRVVRARQIQQERFAGLGYFCNAQLDQTGIERFCAMDESAKKLLHQAVERFHVSMRAYGRILKVARTVADLSGHGRILPQDVAQAIQYRNADGKYWG